mmetsp:Transcript_30916/g.29529  ORF Transcript_30916/g.29529 Transcript_30916/m.29529 type:complete len:544 (-) Transcript_30916:32-1663(-)
MKFTATVLDSRRFIFTIICIVISCYATPLQLVSVDGTCRSTSQIGSYVSTQSISQTGNMCPIFSLIDCLSESDGRLIFNSVLDTTFGPNSRGLCLDMNERGAFVYTAFDNMYSTKFCGSKAADFCGSISNSLCILLSARDVTETLNGYDQIFRRVLKKVMDSSMQSLTSLTILVSNEGTSEEEKEEVSVEINNRLSEIWKDLSPVGEISDKITVEILSMDASDTSSLQSARSSLLAVVDKSVSMAGAPNTLASTLATGWTEVPVGFPRAILSPVQRRSLLNVEAAYTAGIAQIESMVNQWQVRIAEGKVVGKFGDRVQQLLESMRKAYNARTMGTLTVRDRADRARMLDDYLLTAISELFRQQLGNLQIATTNKFRKSLVSLAASTQVLSEEDKKEEEQQALRKALFELRASTSDLEVESLGLSSAELQAEVSTALQLMATEFPETAAYKLEEIRKVEKSAKKPKRKKGQKAINIGLNLVGMLRPPGFGNLQGYLGYATSLLGLPFDLLLGVHNDGDSPEIMGEDREYPILRLQPKVHFDIDV